MSGASPERLMTDEEIAELVKGLGPIDWVQVELIASLPPERRIVPGMRAQAFALSAMRATLRQHYPEMSRSELNLKVLAHFTPLRLPSS
jgi:hypothetical protein